ncbi:cytosolic carboxypeptidase 2 [Prorops nasuta]|uniref:cytosolic carboxypeptidase 2 n=1 Tax=Prorops nasuta TaxID=863751 RepID=UPI0034CFF895
MCNFHECGWLEKKIDLFAGGVLRNLDGMQELSGRFGMFSVPLNVAKPKDAIRAILDARSICDSVTQEIPRWPTECQVIRERVRHIDYTPGVPETFYVPTGKEPKPRPVGDELGTVIYRYCPSSVTNYFSRSCVGGNSAGSLPVIDSFPLLKVTEENFLSSANFCESGDLCFESRFESGNLGKVVKITDTYYQLHLRRDLYTQRHTQWYYFRISNTRSRIIYRLSIVNLCKEDSLYNDGLRPLLYSTEDARTRSIGWRRCGDNITYYRNNDYSDEEKERYTLTFNISFPYDGDTVYLAHCYPYTYSDLQEYLANIVADPAKTRYTKLRLLCRSLAGNGIYYLTITAPSYDEDARRKRGIVVTARVHPGETPSSWTMKGIIDFLTSDSDQARELRERFVFKLVPMLNPDGVIVGNNRCSLSGKDLNRQYRTVMRESYPSVWHTKLMIRRLLEECGVAIYCDLHAHSRKHNIFAYGCESKRSGFTTRLSEQVFPLMLHKNAADKFSFENCKFHIEKGKEGTGRVVVWSMGVQNSYTMEASMGGSTIGSRSGTHFSIQDYEQIGRSFCETLLDYFDQDPTKERLRNKIMTRLLKEGSSAEEPTNIDLTDYSSDEGDTSQASTSDEENLDFLENAWESEKGIDITNCSYPCVPPPSPSSPSSRPISRLNKKVKRATASERNYLQRRRLLNRRAVMDLPTTDPGSDLYEFTDSGDETFARMKKDAAGERSKEAVSEISAEKEEFFSECVMLPSIVRPRSLSFGENFIAEKTAERVAQRSHCIRLSRMLRNLSPPSPGRTDIQAKLTSLRQQIWMGTNMAAVGQMDSFTRAPISWGVSSLVSTHCRTDSEVLLRSCSEKLQTLDYVEEKYGIKKSRKKWRRRRVLQGNDIELEPEEIPDEEVKATKKKRSRIKWQKAVNMNSRVKDTCNTKSSFLSIKADSLKLLNLNASKQVSKIETRRKFRNGGIVVATVSSKKQSRIKTKVDDTIKMGLIEPLCDSSSTDDELLSNSNNKTAKKKDKKKKQQRKVKVAGKKRASSGKILQDAC